MSKGPNDVPNSPDYFAPAYVRRLQQGDEDAWRHFIEGFDGVLFRYFYVRLRDEHVAQELVQDTWLAIVRGIPQLNSANALRGWCWSIAQNKLQNYFRQESRHNQSEVSADDAELGLVVWAGPDPASKVDLDFIKEVLKRLSEECKKLLLMRYVDDISNKEIATEQGGMPIGTVTSKVSRCLEQAQKIAKDLETPRQKGGTSI